MIVLRRIAGEPRYSRAAHTDREIREQLQQPALECIISRMRLVYLGRVARHQPKALCALLHARPGGHMLPWVRLAASDTELLRPFLPRVFSDFLAEPDDWNCLMQDKPAWHALVSRVHFVASVCDRSSHGGTSQQSEVPRAHECECGAAFATLKALESHRRAKHGTRLQIQDIYIYIYIYPPDPLWATRL